MPLPRMVGSRQRSRRARRSTYPCSSRRGRRSRWIRRRRSTWLGRTSRPGSSCRRALLASSLIPSWGRRGGRGLGRGDRGEKGGKKGGNLSFSRLVFVWSSGRARCRSSDPATLPCARVGDGVSLECAGCCSCGDLRDACPMGRGRLGQACSGRYSRPGPPDQRRVFVPGEAR